MDSFLHNHQASLDRQREEAEIQWLFPEEEDDFLHINNQSLYEWELDNDD